jgi:hypothetical protein
VRHDDDREAHKTRKHTCGPVFGRIARPVAVIHAVGAGLNGLFWSVLGGLLFYAGAFGGAHLPPGASHIPPLCDYAARFPFCFS